MHSSLTILFVMGGFFCFYKYFFKEAVKMIHPSQQEARGACKKAFGPPGQL